MASVDIPFNFNNRKFGEKDQREKQLINFYAYQDPNSQKNPEQQIKICQENQDLCFKKVLVCIILCLSAITLFKSCFLIESSGGQPMLIRKQSLYSSLQLNWLPGRMAILYC